MKTNRLIFSTIPGMVVSLGVFLLATGCHSKADRATAIIAAPVIIKPAAHTETPVSVTPVIDEKAAAKVNPAIILARQEVPILCYHQIRDWRPSDSKVARDYIVPPAVFHQQIKMLADSGYHTILPDQLFAYLTTGAALPSKPVLLTFDDTDMDQYTVAFPEMNKYGFKGVFFVMTVSIGRPNYMTREQLKDLSDKGNVIGSHTWDHHNVKKYQGNDWVTQIEKPTKQLEAITGKPIKYFAYPFGLWNPEAIPQLKQRGMIAAFQLSAKRDPQDPLHTIRRIIVPGSWTPHTLNTVIKRSFKAPGA
jgi:peptidoglycan/xylan/chitin deacetylase (PgdA/CDA1 family)